MRQADDSGNLHVVTTATAVTATRRPTWGASDAVMPQVPPADQVERVIPAANSKGFGRNYELRYLAGQAPKQMDDTETDSLTRVWLRDNPPRPLDFVSLGAMCDVFYPRIWLRRARMTPAGTVSITIYFHVNRDDLAAVGTGYLLAQARGQEFRNGFCDHSAQLWAESGQMLATTHQIIFYKE
jgi:acyl-CoA thioesterase